jgi:hypothetical protein
MKFLYSARSHPRAASLFALFLFLAYPLWAKCPVHFVQIRGKIECSFKPDDKVLATLIFSDDQPQTFGEETAIDIHDATFSGRVAFDTYSSSGFLSGDKCHRRPKNVLIRLIEADGMEKYRTSLKIANDFTFDEKQGEYRPNSDVILYGWCQSQCGGTSASPVDCWHKVDAGPFSSLAPSGWEFHQLPGVDTFVGEFVGNDFALKFDFGRYAKGCLKEYKKPTYIIAKESIGGLPARIVRPRAPSHGVTGVYFRKVNGHGALCLWGKDLTAAQQEVALKIFETTRFGGPMPKYLLPPPPKNPE